MIRLNVVPFSASKEVEPRLSQKRLRSATDAPRLRHERRDQNINESVIIFLKRVGLRKRGPKKVGILTRLFATQQRIGIQMRWRKALGKDLPDVERRCLRLQELAIGEASSWVPMLDTFNEVLIQNF